MTPYDKELIIIIIIIIIINFSVTQCILKAANSSKSLTCLSDVTGSAGTVPTEDFYHDYFPYSDSCTPFVHFKNHQFTLIVKTLKNTFKKLAPT